VIHITITVQISGDISEPSILDAFLGAFGHHLDAMGERIEKENGLQPVETESKAQDSGLTVAQGPSGNTGAAGLNDHHRAPEQLSLIDLFEQADRAGDGPEQDRKEVSGGEARSAVSAVSPASLPGGGVAVASAIDVRLDDQCTEDQRPDSADFSPQASVTAVPDFTPLPPSTPAGGSQATCPAANEQPDLGKTQQRTRKLRGPKRPSRKSLLPIDTGEEAMQARAGTLYAALAHAAGMSELQMNSPGPAVPLNPAILDKAKNDYLGRDDKYQKVRATHAGNPALLEQDEHLAGDRARKTIERAKDDLVEIGAVETDVDGHPVAILRLPEVKRILASWGATHIRLCPGGNRRLCGASGNEIQSPLKQKAAPADKRSKQNDHTA